MSFVNHQKIHAKINGRDAGLITAGDIASQDLARIGEMEYNMIFQNRSYRILVEEVDLDHKEIVLTCNFRRYRVSFEDRLDQLIESLGLDRAYDQSLSEVTAPMPGLVLELSVEPGQQVQMGDTLLILEAMKMENVIKAQMDGLVDEVAVSPGDKVDKGRKLIVLKGE